MRTLDDLCVGDNVTLSRQLPLFPLGVLYGDIDQSENAFLIGVEASDSNHGGGFRVTTPNGI